MKTKYRMIELNKIYYLEYFVIEKFFFFFTKEFWKHVPMAYEDFNYYDKLRGYRVELEKRTINSTNTDLNEFILNNYDIHNYIVKNYKKQREYDKIVYEKDQIEHKKLHLSIINSNRLFENKIENKIDR